MQNTAAWLRFVLARALERRFPVPALYAILKPFAALRAARHPVRVILPLPELLGSTEVLQTTRSARAGSYLNRFVEFFPDRLGTAKWRECLRANGLPQLESARRAGRPVVLAFCHFGPSYLLRVWLRAAGISAATLIAGAAQSRSPLKRLQDQASPFADIPIAFYQDQLREALQFLAAGHPLLIALDGDAGRQMTVTAGDGWDFRMATGPLRFAAHCGAELVSCCIVDEGRWRFRIEVGRPVPDQWLADESHWSLAGRHLLDEMIPHVRGHPQQCSRRFIERFQSTAAAGPEFPSHEFLTPRRAAAR